MSTQAVIYSRTEEAATIQHTTGHKTITLATLWTESLLYIANNQLHLSYLA